MRRWQLWALSLAIKAGLYLGGADMGSPHAALDWVSDTEASYLARIVWRIPPVYCDRAEGCHVTGE